jgi:hypothetical protein
MLVHKQQTSPILAPPLFYMSLNVAAGSGFNPRSMSTQTIGAVMPALPCVSKLAAGAWHA